MRHSVGSVHVTSRMQSCGFLPNSRIACACRFLSNSRTACAPADSCQILAPPVRLRIPVKFSHPLCACGFLPNFRIAFAAGDLLSQAMRKLSRYPQLHRQCESKQESPAVQVMRFVCGFGSAIRVWIRLCESRADSALRSVCGFDSAIRVRIRLCDS